MHRLSLAQQIAQLGDVAPVDFDPEDIQVSGIDHDLDLDNATDNSAARAHYVDVGPSSLRKLHESLSDPKYDGSKVSRKLTLDDWDDSESSLSEDTELDSRVSEEPSHTPESKQDCDSDTQNPVEASTGHPSLPPKSSDLSSGLRKIREEDREKGKAISRQIALWDSILDARIRLQKCVAAGNRLPSLTEDEASDDQIHVSLLKVLEEARLLSNEIFDLQEHLFAVNESVQPPRKRRRGTETDCSVANYAEELRDASRAVSELERVYHPLLVETLAKWSSKIQAVAPSVLLPSNRNAFSRPTQYVKSATQLIDETLAEHGKVLARTRIYRGKGSRLGATEDGREEDVEVFDDIDFYHQLLRDIIDARGGGTGGSDDWMAAQKQKKAKKKVDTKASKGRKLRYEVHEKMQNFMVPVPVQGGWHEGQIDELFASLLGRVIV